MDILFMAINSLLSALFLGFWMTGIALFFMTHII